MGGGCTEAECPGTLFLLTVRNVAGEGNEKQMVRSMIITLNMIGLLFYAVLAWHRMSLFLLLGYQIEKWMKISILHGTACNGVLQNHQKPSCISLERVLSTRC